MRPCLTPPFLVRGIEYGGPKPLFCVPLTATNLEGLLNQTRIAHDLAPDLVEWRADFYQDLDRIIESLQQVRSVLANEPVLFTLRIREEGGAQEIPRDFRRKCIEAVASSGAADMIDVELCNGAPFLKTVLGAARARGVRTIVSFHDFDQTPAKQELLRKIEKMNRHGADVAKIAVMPREPEDVLQLLETTLEARKRFPQLGLSTTSMGRTGVLSRVAGFLFGSDMAYAAGCESSAPGQIPIAEARAITERLFAGDE